MLSVESEEQAQLPGYREPAVVRHFEPPGGVSTRFYEVRAKSILNRVPEASRMPFRWTVNPYRGCTHACTYCVSGETLVLLGDGRHRPIAELDVGDEIYGTVGGSIYRRYVRTRVLDKWITVQPAYRVVLKDGTELIASGDHRFLSNRGWKHVANSPPQMPDRPHLTPRNHLIGTGQFAPQPRESPEYRRGYLCGMIRGDGHIGSYTYARPSAGTMRIHGFRLALADADALQRAREYLAQERIDTAQRLFAAATPGHREMRAIAAASGDAVEQITDLVQWPILPSLDWIRGFWLGSSTRKARGARACCASPTQIPRSSPGLRRARAGSASGWHRTRPGIQTGSHS